MTHLVTDCLDLKGLPAQYPVNQTEVILLSHPRNRSWDFYIYYESAQGEGHKTTFTGFPNTYAASFYFFPDSFSQAGVKFSSWWDDFELEVVASITQSNYQA